MEGLLPSSSSRPVLTYRLQRPIDSFPALGNGVHSGSGILCLIEKCERPVLLLFTDHLPGEVGVRHRITFLPYKKKETTTKENTMTVQRKRWGLVNLFVFHFVSKLFRFFFFPWPIWYCSTFVRVPQGIQSASLLCSFPVPHSIIELLIPLMQCASICQNKGWVESPIVLILQTLEILELANIVMVKDVSEHWCQHQGLCWK